MRATISGTYLGSKRSTGTFEPEDEPGKKVPYDFTSVVINQGGGEVAKVRLPKDVHEHPWKEGDRVLVEIEFFARAATVTPDSLAKPAAVRAAG